MKSNESSQTLHEGSGVLREDGNNAFKLDDIEPIMVLTTHMTSDELLKVEDGLIDHDAPITYDVSEARVFIGRIRQKRRAAIELRTRGIFTEEYDQPPSNEFETASTVSEQPTRLVKVDSCHSAHDEVSEVSTIDLTTDDTSDLQAKAAGDSRGDHVPNRKLSEGPKSPESAKKAETVTVITTDWLTDCLGAHQQLPLDKYIIYSGVRAERPFRSNTSRDADFPRFTRDIAETASALSSTGYQHDILERARAEGPPPQPKYVSKKRFHGAVEPVDQDRAYSSTTQKLRLAGTSKSDGVATLQSQSTTEHDLDLTNDIPEPPEWVKQGLGYACQRSTPVNNPNSSFVDMLKTIRVARTLTGDETGIRAYSTAIAAIGAYPYTLTSPREILALPGCSAKIAALFAEWKNSGEQNVAAVREINTDERLQVLQTFYDIWGVGATTARSFYNRGWRDLDDIVLKGWDSLKRVQQLGVKYYEEFQEKIPRPEVEHIRDIVHQHVQRICGRPDDVRTCIVGGYRRGKSESGDADIMVSHLDDARLLDVIDDIVVSLSEDGWITHSLGTTHSMSHRGNATLPYQGPGSGRGFDSLDKAMVVWQDPRYEEGDAVDGKNPNIHRRVDIILSPWRTIGCAVLGWSAGTTFERDLRRYAKHKKNWKFDSSGIRDRATGDIVDVEAAGGRSETIEEAEKKVFEGLELEYREPWERCTG